MRSIQVSGRLAFFAFFSFFTFACGSAQRNSGLRFDGHRSIAVDGVIERGYISSEESDPALQEKRIRTQLKYTVGQLNGIGGGPSLERLDVAILDSYREEGSSLWRVDYKAILNISWPRELPLPPSYTFYLPRRTDRAFIDLFLNDDSGAKRCLVANAHDVGTGNAWYYYRPNRTTCEITKGDHAEVARIDVRLALSAENSEGKYPEYAKVWEDGRLVVTAIFAKNSEDSVSLDDAGIQEYRRFYSSLVRRYGRPLSSNLPPEKEGPSGEDEFVKMSFQSTKGIIDIEIDLIGRVGSDKEKAFEERYNERTLISDLISYSGHAGYGANIRDLAKLGRFAKGQYQIFLLNGCSTFSYLNDALRKAHQAVNPEEGPDKYVDFVLNSLPSYFNAGTPANMALISALAAPAKTYRQIFAGVGPQQRIVVTGEQDNADWLPRELAGD